MRNILALVACLVATATQSHAAVCTFEDGGSGFTTIEELGLPAFEAGQIVDHILGNEFVPTQIISGDTTVLFDTPTKDVDAAVEFLTQTAGSTQVPISTTNSGSSTCVPYTPSFCFREKAGSSNPTTIE